MDKHFPKNNNPKSPQDMFKKFLKIGKDNEDEICDSLRTFLMWFFQKRYALKQKRPSAELQELFDMRRSQLTTNMMFAHNLVRLKLGKKALAPKESDCPSIAEYKEKDRGKKLSLVNE